MSMAFVSHSRFVPENLAENQEKSEKIIKRRVNISTHFDDNQIIVIVLQKKALTFDFNYRIFFVAIGAGRQGKGCDNVNKQSNFLKDEIRYT